MSSDKAETKREKWASLFLAAMISKPPTAEGVDMKMPPAERQALRVKAAIQYADLLQVEADK